MPNTDTDTCAFSKFGAKNMTEFQMYFATQCEIAAQTDQNWEMKHQVLNQHTLIGDHKYFNFI